MAVSFKGAHFPKDIILHAVFFYLVDFHPEVTQGGCGQKPGLFSRHKAEAFTVFDRAAATK